MATPQPLRLSLLITGNASQLNAELNRVDGNLRHTGSIGQATGAQVSQGMGSIGATLRSISSEAFSLNGALRTLAGSFALLAVYSTGKQLVDYADSLQLVDARVKTATTSTSDYAAANQALMAVSLASHSSLAENANLFARTNKAIEQMGGSIKNTIAFTDLLAKSLKVSGASQSEAASVTRQMSQAFASGVLRGDEFNSIMENGSRLAFALADGLQVSIGDLRKMAEAGDLTAPKVLQATLSQTQKINDEFKLMPVTVAAALTDVETQFGRYINAANQANGTTSTLAAGVEVLAHNLPLVLDAAILVGEALALMLVSRGVSSLAAYTTARVASSRADSAASALLAAHSQALIEDARRTVAATTATTARIQAEIAATDATLAGTLSMGERMAVTNALNVQTRALTQATIAQALAQTQLNTMIAANTTKITAMGVAMGALNVAMVGVMAYQFGSWLNSFDAVANTATEVMGRWAQKFEDISYRASIAKAVLTGGWDSIDDITAAHERNTQAINDNVQSTIEFRKKLSDAGLTVAEWTSYVVSTRSPMEKYIDGVDKANRLLAVSPGLVVNYRAELVRLRNEFERTEEVAAAPFEKIKKQLQDEIDQLKKTELEFRSDKLIRDNNITDPIQKNLIREQVAEAIRLREEKALMHQADKQHAEELKVRLKDWEQENKALIERRIVDVGRMAAAELAAQSALQKELEFNWQQGNVAFADYAAERERIIKQETAIKLAEYAKQRDVLAKNGTATDIDASKVTDPSHLAYFEKLAAQYGDIKKAAVEYQKTYQDIIVTARAEAGEQEKIAALDEKVAQARREQQTALADLHRTAAEQRQRDIEGLTALSLKYMEVTGTARDAFLARQRADLAQPLKDAVLNNDWRRVDVLRDTAKAETQQFDLQHAQSYAEQLRQINTDTRNLGITSSQAFDVINKGAGGVANAFTSLAQSLNQLDDSIAQNAVNIATVQADHTKSAEEKAGLLTAYAKHGAALEKERLTSSLTGIRQIAGATADMFGENTAARQAFHAVEMTLGAIELARTLANTSATIASNGVAIASNIAAGASKIWAQMGIFAPIGLAAMAASLVAYGVGAIGGSSIAEPPKSSPDAGTVLGDSTAQSNSVDNLFKLLQDIHASEYAELRGINSGVNDLQTALSGTITRLFQAGGLDTSNKGIDLSYGIGDSITRSFTTGAGLAATAISTGISTALSFGVTAGITALSGAAVTGATTAAAGVLAGLGIGSMAGPIGTVAGLLFSGINALFSGGYRDVTERGIQTKAQTLGDVVGGSSLNAMQYNVIKTREWDLFSDSTRFDTVFNKLDNKVVDSLTNVFESAGSVSLMLANALGGDLSDKVKNYVLPELKIDLTKLNAEDASKKLNAVISTTLDTMANDLFAGVVGEYQQIGEGMLETAARIVSEVSVVKSALNTSGLSISGDTIKISDSLVQLAGGIKSFQEGFSGYYDKFYTDAEKQAQLQATLTSSLGELFMALPATRQGYRDVLEALNLNNEADQKRYTLLIQLSDAADSYYKSLESGLKTLEDGVKSAFDTAAGLLQKQVDTYRGFANQFKSFSDSLLMTAANPQQKYDLAKTAFVDIKAVLDSSTSTTEQKDAALAQLQAVTQTYLDASRAYNGSSLDYFKDFAEAQALLSKEITANNNKADLAQSQLDKITEQVTALGLLNTSVLTVDGSVRALTIAMVGLVKAKESELQIAADNANRAVFNKNEAARKSAYETPIANKATAIGGIAQKQEDRIGWSGNSSKWAFGASGAVDPSTGNSTSQVSSYAHSGDVNNVIRHQLDNAKGQFSAIGKMIQNIIGGDLPEVFISLKSDGRDRDAFESYTFNGQTRTLKSYDIDPLVRLFAKDSVDYLANALSDKTWADQLKKISFSSIGGGMSDLSSLMDHLRNPFKDATYDPNKVYVDGSHRAGLDYVPRDGYIAELHQGERVLTAEQAKQSRVIVGPDNQEGIDRLIRANKELSNQHRADADKHTQAVIDTLVEGIKANVTGQAALERQLKDVKTELERTRRELAQARVAG